jgi:glyoxylase-like metal-dependent hydrolase (beta-lactamase superfamily II)
MNGIRTYTGGFTATNGYTFPAQDGLIAVDAPDGMAQWLEQTGQRLAALFLTHWHFDHVVDAARIAREHACEVWAYGPSTPSDRLEKLLVLAGMDVSIENYPVHHPLQGLDTARIAGADFLLRHVPGHSPDSLVLIHEPTRIIFSGDTVMDGGIGRTDFPGGDYEELVTGIRQKILTFPGDFRILPGHGGISTVSEELRGNPYLR